MTYQFKEKNAETIFPDGPGYFGVAVFNPKHYQNVGTLWRTAAICGAQFLCTIGHRYSPIQLSDTLKCHLNMPIFNFDDFDLFRKSAPTNCDLVALEMSEKAEDIANYRHRERCIYIVGSEDYGIPHTALDYCKDQVKLYGNISMNLAVAGSILIHSRMTCKEFRK